MNPSAVLTAAKWIVAIVVALTPGGLVALGLVGLAHSCWRRFHKRRQTERPEKK